MKISTIHNKYCTKLMILFIDMNKIYKNKKYQNKNNFKQIFIKLQS